MGTPLISVIVNSNNDRRFQQFETRFLAPLGLANLELIRIPDAVSMSEGYNRAAETAKGDWLFFCHDDIGILELEAGAALDHAMRHSDVFGPCGTRRVVSGNWYDGGRPYNAGSVVAPDPARGGSYRLEVFGVSARPLTLGIQALDGLFIACKRRVFDTIRGFDEARLHGFHTYDIDFSFRAHLAGFRCVVANDLVLLHDSNVSEFSQAKLDEWKREQEGFEQRFGAYFEGPAGERTHENHPLERPESGPPLRRKISRSGRWVRLLGH